MNIIIENLPKNCVVFVSSNWDNKICINNNRLIFDNGLQPRHNLFQNEIG